jgi:hypothetical protein
MQQLGDLYATTSAALGGAALVGMRVCVDWGRHNANEAGLNWYTAQLTDWHAGSGEYEVGGAAVQWGQATVCVCVRLLLLKLLWPLL